MKTVGKTYWVHRTNTGSIVYKRKKHKITPVDVMRWVRSMQIVDKKMAEIQIREIIYYLLDLIDEKGIRPTKEQDLAERWEKMLDGILQRLSSVLLLYVPASSAEAALEMVNSRLSVIPGKID